MHPGDSINDCASCEKPRLRYLSLQLEFSRGGESVRRYLLLWAADECMPCFAYDFASGPKQARLERSGRNPNDVARLTYGHGVLVEHRKRLPKASFQLSRRFVNHPQLLGLCATHFGIRLRRWNCVYPL